MTGQKDRYTTTEKLWKLDDETLTTPKHDEMVLDLLDLEYVKALIPQAFAWYGRDMSNLSNFFSYYTRIGGKRVHSTDLSYICGYLHRNKLDILDAAGGAA